MRPISVAEDIIPIAKFKARASRVINGLREHGKPVIITQNGQAVAVLVSPRDFDAFCESARFMSGLGAGLADLRKGALWSDEKVDAYFDARYGKEE